MAPASGHDAGAALAWLDLILRLSRLRPSVSPAQNRKRRALIISNMPPRYVDLFRIEVKIGRRRIGIFAVLTFEHTQSDQSVEKISPTVRS